MFLYFYARVEMINAIRFLSVLWVVALLVACGGSSLIQKITATDNSITIGWDGSSFGDNIAEYQLAYSTNQKGWSDTIATKEVTHTFASLLPDTGYYFLVQAKFSDGTYSQEEISAPFSTKEAGENNSAIDQPTTPNPTQSTEPIQVHGSITDYVTGKPINIVSVRPSNGSSVSSARGSYNIILPHSNEVSLSFSHEDYIGVTKKINATKDQLLDVQLVPSGKGLGIVEGFVTNQNDFPVSEATVRIEAHTIQTDATGWYSIAGVTSGTQVINVSKGGGQYKIYSKEVFIKESAVTTHHPVLGQEQILITLTTTHTRVRQGEGFVLRAVINGTAQSFVWASDKEGTLSNQLNTSATLQILGLHLITFTARDVDDNIQIETLEVEVLPAINTKPTSPNNIAPTNVTSSSISLTWKKSEDKDGFIQNYYVSFKENRSGNWSNEQTTAVPNYEWESNIPSSYTIENLHNRTNYIFRIRAFDNDGAYSDFSYSNYITTKASTQETSAIATTTTVTQTTTNPISIIGNLLLDSKNKKMWQRQGFTKGDGLAYLSEESGIRVLSWEDGIDYCDALILDGYSDWKLPDYYAMKTLVSPTTTKDTAGFKYRIIQEFVETMPKIDSKLAFWTSEEVGGLGTYMMFHDTSFNFWYEFPDAKFFIVCARDYEPDII